MKSQLLVLGSLLTLSFLHIGCRHEGNGPVDTIVMEKRELESSLLGEWPVLNLLHQGNAWEFRSDGTVTYSGPGGGREGLFKWLDETQIRIDWSFYPQDLEVWKIMILGEELMMRDMSGYSMRCARKGSNTLKTELKAISDMTD